MMKPAIFARFVRIHAMTWGNFAAARLEFEGCHIGRFANFLIIVLHAEIVTTFG